MPKGAVSVVVTIGYYPIQRRAEVSLCIEPDPELDSLLPDKDWKVHELGPLAFGKWSSRLRPILEF